MKKKGLSFLSIFWIMLFILHISIVNCFAISENNFDSKLSEFRNSYPNYSRWTGSFDGGTQCFGFAHMLAYNMYGSKANTWAKSYDINSVKKGDVVQYGNTSGSGHTIFVTNVSGSTITFVDCNGNGNYSGGTKYQTCGIKWDNTISISASMFGKYSFSYLYSSPNFENPINHTIDESYGHDFTATCTSKQYTLTENHSTEGSRWIDAGDVCTIHNVYTDGCCYVTYPSGSSTREAWGKIEWFSFTKVHNPTCCIDSAYGGTGYISIGGWAFDEDNSSESIPIHVYLDDTGIAAFNTDVNRTDVNNVYGVSGIHGFDRKINVSVSGSHRLRVFAINIGGGDNVLMFDSTVEISAENEVPTISNAKVLSADSGGYMIYAEATDNIGIKSVRVATWTDTDGQDDLKWNDMVNTDTNIYKFYVPYSEHSNDKTSVYINYIYAYDVNGNEKSICVNFIPSREVKPTIKNITISDMDDTGYTISCDILCNINTSQANVCFPTWTTSDGQDDLMSNWPTNSKGTLDGNHVATYRVNYADHNNEKGLYLTHIYVYDTYGNYTCSADIKEPVYVLVGTHSPTETIKYNNHLYELYDNFGEYRWVDAKVFCEKIGGHLATVSDENENEIVKNLTASSTKKECWIGASDRETEGSWKWVTDEEFSYTNWRDGEPNNDGDQDCLCITSQGEWDDAYYKVMNKSFICEYELITVMFDANGGSDAPSSQTKKDGTSLTLSTDKPTRNGYIFKNWNTKADGSGTSFNAGDTYDKDEDLILYAIWQETHTSGDVNDDCKVNNKDATLMLQYFADWDSVTLNEDYLDLNNDGRKNNKDATYLLQYLAGWDVELH